MANSEALYLESLTSDPKNLVYVLSNNLPPISGFIDADYSFGATSNFGPTSIAGQIADSTVSSAISKTTDNIAKGIGTDKTTKTFLQTQVAWGGSEVQAISLNIVVMAKKGQNPLDIANFVWDYVLPGSYADDLLQTVPGGYTIDALSNATGEVSVYIGEWFKAIDMFVVTTATVEISKQRVKGTSIPLYAKISMVLSPSRLFSAQEFKNCFIGASGANIGLFSGGIGGGGGGSF